MIAALVLLMLLLAAAVFVALGVIALLDAHDAKRRDRG